MHTEPLHSNNEIQYGDDLFKSISDILGELTQSPIHNFWHNVLQFYKDYIKTDRACPIIFTAAIVAAIKLTKDIDPFFPFQSPDGDQLFKVLATIDAAPYFEYIIESQHLNPETPFYNDHTTLIEELIPYAAERSIATILDLGAEISPPSDRQPYFIQALFCFHRQKDLKPTTSTTNIILILCNLAETTYSHIIDFIPQFDLYKKYIVDHEQHPQSVESLINSIFQPRFTRELPDQRPSRKKINRAIEVCVWKTLLECIEEAREMRAEAMKEIEL